MLSKFVPPTQHHDDDGDNDDATRTFGECRCLLEGEAIEIENNGTSARTKTTNEQRQYTLNNERGEQAEAKSRTAVFLRTINLASTSPNDVDEAAKTKADQPTC